MTNRFFALEERISGVLKISEPRQTCIDVESYDILKRFKEDPI